VKRLLLIDHYDSFTYTIKAYFEALQVQVEVVQHDSPDLLNLEKIAPSMLVFSPGPGHPDKANTAVELIKKYHKIYPMLGVCLGHQCIAKAFGGEVIHAPEIMHGKQSLIHHEGRDLFAGIPSLFSATRYHSLVVKPETLPRVLRMTAWTFDQKETRMIMGLAHQHYPVFGVQYHPEAVLTEHGYLLFSNFLREVERFSSAC
jgi:anthranilate synthase/aminodeoxychorismate synthase-like glutamine amidotransferase